ncbi:MAG: ATP-binding protein [Dermatophilaceae bacterium]
MSGSGSHRTRPRPRGSRNFVAHTLLDWGLGGLIPSASLVASELVTNSTVHAGTEVELSIGWTQGALRLTVRDNSPGLTHLRTTHLGQHGRGLTIVLALCRAFGVLPTADDGKVVWAVLNSVPSPEIEESLVFPLLEQVAEGHADVCATGGTHDQPSC